MSAKAAPAALQAFPVQISTDRFMLPSLFLPESTRTEPSPSTVPVGYHRPPPMLGMFTNFSLSGLKAAVRGSPKNGAYCSGAPRTQGLPSGKTTMPLQNMSQAIG